jgi:hypothetical protein
VLNGDTKDKNLFSAMSLLAYICRFAHKLVEDVAFTIFYCVKSTSPIFNGCRLHHPSVIFVLVGEEIC